MEQKTNPVRDRVVDFLLDQVWFDPESSLAEKQIDSITELLSGTPQPTSKGRAELSGASE